MLIWMCRSKIKGGKVTEKKLHYDGSITLDKEIIEKAEILPGEMVYVLNLNNGARIITYVIEGKRGSGVICLNGPAARFFEINDEVIILATSLMEKKEAEGRKIRLVVLDEKNKVKEIREV